MRKIICDLCHKEVKIEKGEKVVRINYGFTIPKNYKICENCLKAVFNMQKGIAEKS